MAVSTETAALDYRNLDDLFAYTTPKVVVIRDRRLGGLYYFVIIFIAVYVFGFQIMFSNAHFPMLAVTGTSRLQIQHPTKNNCSPDDRGCEASFKSLEQLEYCKEFSGESTLPAAYKRPCVFADRRSIAPDGMLEEHLLVPTLVSSEVQNKGCEPSADNGYNCDDEYVVDKNAKESVFVADIEDYTLHISHTYSQVGDAGTNTDVQGYYLECDRNQKRGIPDPARIVYGTGELACDGKVLRKPVKCLTGDCSFKPVEEEDEEGFLLQSPSSWMRHGQRLSLSLIGRAIGLLGGSEHHVDKAEQRKPAEFAETYRDYSIRHHHHRNRPHQGQLMRDDHSRILAVQSDGLIRSESPHMEDAEEPPENSVDADEVHPHSHSHHASHSEDSDETPGHTGRSHAATTNNEEIKTGDDNEEKPAATEENAPPPNTDIAALREGVYSLPHSDVFSVSKILALCDMTFDRTHNADGKTLREAGTVITIEAVYKNLHPFASCFGDTHVEYEYRVSRRPLEAFGDEAYSKYQPNFPAQRIMEQRKGIYVVVKIGGQFGQFSMTTLLILIASSLSLMKVATVVVDHVAIWLMSMKETYVRAKFQYTERVYDMQKDLDALLGGDLDFDNLPTTTEDEDAEDGGDVEGAPSGLASPALEPAPDGDLGAASTAGTTAAPQQEQDF